MFSHSFYVWAGWAVRWTEQPDPVGIPTSWTLGPVLFDSFVNDSDDGAECTLSKLADDTKMEGMSNMPESQIHLWFVSQLQNVRKIATLKPILWINESETTEQKSGILVFQLDFCDLLCPWVSVTGLSVSDFPYIYSVVRFTADYKSLVLNCRGSNLLRHIARTSEVWPLLS